MTATIVPNCRGSTRAAVAFFSNLGGCYVSRIVDIPPSTGYGDPVQKFFNCIRSPIIPKDILISRIPFPSQG